MTARAAAQRNATLRDVTINIRAQQRQRDLIDHAAAVLRKSRSDFMLDVACREAESVLLDQRLFQLDDETWNRFVEMLDAPPRENEKLQTLLARKAPWET